MNALNFSSECGICFIGVNCNGNKNEPTQHEQIAYMEPYKSTNSRYFINYLVQPSKQYDLLEVAIY